MDGFIYLAICLDNLLNDCHPRKVVSAGRNETATKPTELDNTRFQQYEHAHRHRDSLCFYCDSMNHHITLCSVCSETPTGTLGRTFTSVHSKTESSKLVPAVPLFVLPVKISHSDQSFLKLRLSRELLRPPNCHKIRNTTG